MTTYEQILIHPITLLQAINENIEGVQSAPALVPTNYSSAKMPMAMTWGGQGETRGQVGISQTQRSYAVEVLVKPSTVGIVPASFQDTRLLLGRFMDTYLALYSEASDQVLDYGIESGIRVQIDKSKAIIDSDVDSAMEVLPEVYYYGFRLSIPLIVEWGSELL